MNELNYNRYMQIDGQHLNIRYNLSTFHQVCSYAQYTLYTRAVLSFPAKNPMCVQILEL